MSRRYTDSVGKIINGQIGLFAAYKSLHGHAFIDGALYLPNASHRHSPATAAGNSSLSDVADITSESAPGMRSE